MKNEEAYVTATRESDWKKICELSELTFDRFGTKKELKRLPEFIEDNEIVFGFASGIIGQSGESNTFDFGTNTWLVVLTSERFLFLDHAMFTSSIDSQSVRLSKIQGVSAAQGWMLGKIMVDIGNRQISIDNCMKGDVKKLADIANRLLREKEELSADQPGSSQAPLEKIEKLAELHSKGILSDEEFTSAKTKLISEL
ncbi:MAG: PH domain-containing protein [Rhodospirillaceae bacterium]|nr:PH domain-containing protein [Rhodospirillaceae bacterium]